MFILVKQPLTHIIFLKDKNYKTVIVISPSHSEYFPGISIYDGDAYETPFGIVEIDQTVTDKLVENSKTIFRGIQGHQERTCT